MTHMYHAKLQRLLLLCNMQSFQFDNTILGPALSACIVKIFADLREDRV